MSVNSVTGEEIARIAFTQTNSIITKNGCDTDNCFQRIFGQCILSFRQPFSFLDNVTTINNH